MISNSNATKKALTKLQSLSTNQESEFGWPKVHPTSDWYDDVIPQKKGENSEWYSICFSIEHINKILEFCSSFN